MNSNPDVKVDDTRIFIWVLIATSIAFVWVLLPFASPILWACILSVIFYPLHRRLVSLFRGSKNLAAVTTIVISLVILIIPLSFILTSLISETSDLYKRFESGEIRTSEYLDQITKAFPIAKEELAKYNISIDEIKQQLNSVISSGANIITKQSLKFGQNTLSFLLNLGLMLYLAYYLLRDGPKIINWIKIAFPMDDDRESHLFAKFSEVSRATVKGNLVVGLIQGGLGGFIFWVIGIQPAILWAAVMAITSLIPAVGTGLIWAPVAICLLAIGDYIEGVGLIAFGVFVIGLVDNLLRPVLVGRDTKLPDYIVLFSTLGGIGLVGLQGFVVGPLIAALFFTLWNMFVLEFNPAGAKKIAIEDDVAEWEERAENNTPSEPPSGD